MTNISASVLGYFWVKFLYHFKRAIFFELVVEKTYFIFSPDVGEDEPILTHIFQMGWFNYQSVFSGKQTGWKIVMTVD